MTQPSPFQVPRLPPLGQAKVGKCSTSRQSTDALRVQGTSVLMAIARRSITPLPFGHPPHGRRLSDLGGGTKPLRGNGARGWRSAPTSLLFIV